MPFKSESQHRKFRAMLARGEIDKKTFDKWMNETKQQQGKKSPIKKLPERVEKKESTLAKQAGKLPLLLGGLGVGGGLAAYEAHKRGLIGTKTPKQGMPKIDPAGTTKKKSILDEIAKEGSVAVGRRIWEISNGR